MLHMYQKAYRAARVPTWRITPRQTVYCVIICLALMQLASYLFRSDQTTSSFSIRDNASDDYSSCLPTPLRSNDEYLQYFNTSSSAPTCRQWRRLGVNDGSDHEQHVCFDEEYKINPQDCLVISHGITDWGFEDDFDSFGCSVYALDPFLPDTKQRLAPNTHFLDTSLAAFEGRSMIERDGKAVFFSVTRLENLLQDLKLGASLVDYLKLDMPGMEEVFLQDVLLTSPRVLRHVKQLSITIPHTDPKEDDFDPLTNADIKNESSSADPPVNSHYATMWTYLQLLHCNGFTLLHTTPLGNNAHRAVFGRIPQEKDLIELEDWAITVL